MFSNVGNSKLISTVVGAALLATAANFLRPVEEIARAGTHSGAIRSEQLAASVGHGSALALLGGMRSLVASGSWLQTNLAWERQDLAATTALINLTVAADERPLYFWLNGARILANDIPEWRMTGPVPLAYRQKANEEQAQLALRFLEKGLHWHGPDPAIYIEMANIHLRRRHDLEEAARYYRIAAEQPGAPYYAARIHGELLHELRRPAEALAWLRKTLATLPVDDEMARRDVIVERIAILERELTARPADVF